MGRFDAAGRVLGRAARAVSGALLAALLVTAGSARAAEWPTRSGDFEMRDFRFGSGETLPVLRLHYRTLGAPRRDASGHVLNAVLLLHGTGGNGGNFLNPVFADELFGPGRPLDIQRYFIVMPDGVGHGDSSKPSDGLRARFPHYDYDDMVAADYRLLTEGLKVDHLRLVFGTSMGCMHAFVLGEAHPDFMDAMMPMACLPVPIAGRNRMWREMAIQAVKLDPDWKGGDYAEEPVRALRTVADLLVIAGSAPLPLQIAYPTRAAADAYEAAAVGRALQGSSGRGLDANDIIYALDASRNYDPEPGLGRIRARVLWINTGDDFINPPELGIAEREAPKLPNARFVLIPAGPETHGHGSHTWAVLWKDRLANLLETTP